MFTDSVKKKAKDIATADIRMYLSQDGTLKMSTNQKEAIYYKEFL